MFSKYGCMEKPKSDNRLAMLEVKKPKYLKNPSINRLIKTLRNRNFFLLSGSFASDIFMPQK